MFIVSERESIVFFGLKGHSKKKKNYDLRWDFPGGPVVRLRAPNTGGLGSTPGQWTRSHMLQLKPSYPNKYIS